MLSGVQITYNITVTCYESVEKKVNYFILFKKMHRNYYNYDHDHDPLSLEGPNLPYYSMYFDELPPPFHAQRKAVFSQYADICSSDMPLEKKNSKSNEPEIRKKRCRRKSDGGYGRA